MTARPSGASCSAQRHRTMPAIMANVVIRMGEDPCASIAASGARLTRTAQRRWSTRSFATATPIAMMAPMNRMFNYCLREQAERHAAMTAIVDHDERDSPTKVGREQQKDATIARGAPNAAVERSASAPPVHGRSRHAGWRVARSRHRRNTHLMRCRDLFHGR
jgi:hypothetical protein